MNNTQARPIAGVVAGLLVAFLGLVFVPGIATVELVIILVVAVLVGLLVAGWRPGRK